VVGLLGLVVDVPFLISLSLSDAVVGKELFWPINDDGNVRLPYWPKLTIFRSTIEPRALLESGILNETLMKL
jgi:hypothetical protein